MENTANHITLTGTLASLPAYSHQNHERRFFRFLLSVERLSGAEDLLPVLAAEDLLLQTDLFQGERFTVDGQIRSFNNREPVGPRLILCVYALAAREADHGSMPGRAAAVPEDGLYPLHPVGQDGAGRRGLSDRHGADADGQAPEPDVSQEFR